MTLPDDDVRAHGARRLEERQRRWVDHYTDQRTLCMSGIYQCCVVKDTAKKVRVLDNQQRSIRIDQRTQAPLIPPIFR